ncbi:MAG: hypothetical protein JST80_00450 [Bdellovibrionales bacterium]|nr:hypothetical protein [Bdellovibrionales bacterium]
MIFQRVFHIAVLASLAISSFQLAMAQTPNDIIFQTRVQTDTLNWLIDKTRVIMGNAQIEDMLTGETTIDTNPTFKLEEMTDDPNAIKLRDVFAETFKRDLKNAVVRLRIPKVFYQISSLIVNPKGLNVVDPTLDLKVQAQIKGLTTRLSDGIQADVMIPNAKTGELESFLTGYVDPVTLKVSEDIEPMSFDVEFEAVRDAGFKFNLKSYDVSGLPAYVERNKGRLPILASVTEKPVSVNEIRINPVIVRLNKLSRTVNFDAFKPMIQKSMDKMVGAILSMIGDSLRNTLGPKILKSVFSHETRSDMMVANEHIYTRYATARFSQPMKDQLLLGIQGDLCTSKNYKAFADKCAEHETPYEPVREITEENKKNGLDQITQALASNKADLVISLTEEYINRLLKTTIDAELWDDRLEEDGLWLGEKGVFAVFDKQTQQPEMFIDLYYGGDGTGGIQKLFINGRKPIRFPLRLSTSIAFPLVNGVPHMVIKTEKLLSDRNEIINGIPEYGMESRLVRLFRKKIAKMIIKMASKLEGQVAVDMDFPILKGVGLERTTYEATPYGRLNWYFKL